MGKPTQKEIDRAKATIARARREEMQFEPHDVNPEEMQFEDHAVNPGEMQFEDHYVSDFVSDPADAQQPQRDVTVGKARIDETPSKRKPTAAPAAEQTNYDPFSDPSITTGPQEVAPLGTEPVPDAAMQGVDPSGVGNPSMWDNIKGAAGNVAGQLDPRTPTDPFDERATYEAMAREKAQSDAEAQQRAQLDADLGSIAGGEIPGSVALPGGGVMDTATGEVTSGVVPEVDPAVRQQMVDNAEATNAASASFMSMKRAGVPDEVAAPIAKAEKDAWDKINRGSQMIRSANDTMGKAAAAELGIEEDVYGEVAENDRAMLDTLGDNLKDAGKKVNAEIVDLNSTMAKIKNFEVSPDKYWEKKGLLGRLGLAFASGLAGILQVQGRLNSNPVLDSVNKAINRDMQAQQMNMNKMIRQAKLQGANVNQLMHLKTKLISDAKAGRALRMQAAKTEIQQRIAAGPGQEKVIAAMEKLTGKMDIEIGKLLLDSAEGKYKAAIGMEVERFKVESRERMAGMRAARGRGAKGSSKSRVPKGGDYKNTGDVFQVSKTPIKFREGISPGEQQKYRNRAKSRKSIISSMNRYAQQINALGRKTKLFDGTRWTPAGRTELKRLGARIIEDSRSLYGTGANFTEPESERIKNVFAIGDFSLAKGPSDLLDVLDEAMFDLGRDQENDSVSSLDDPTGEVAPGHKEYFRPRYSRTAGGPEDDKDVGTEARKQIARHRSTLKSAKHGSREFNTAFSGSVSEVDVILSNAKTNPVKFGLVDDDGKPVSGGKSAPMVEAKKGINALASRAITREEKNRVKKLRKVYDNLTKRKNLQKLGKKTVEKSERRESYLGNLGKSLVNPIWGVGDLIKKVTD